MPEQDDFQVREVLEQIEAQKEAAHAREDNDEEESVEDAEDD